MTVIKSSHGDITLGNVMKGVAVHTKFGRIKAGKVSPQSRLSTNFGNIDLDNVMEGVSVSTNFGSIKAGEVSPQSHLSTNVGIIRVTKGDEHSLTTNFGFVSRG
jgi:hypothetical protein